MKYYVQTYSHDIFVCNERKPRPIIGTDDCCLTHKPYTLEQREKITLYTHSRRARWHNEQYSGVAFRGPGSDAFVGFWNGTGTDPRMVIQTSFCQCIMGDHFLNPCL